MLRFVERATESLTYSLAACLSASFRIFSYEKKVQVAKKEKKYLQSI